MCCTRWIRWRHRESDIATIVYLPANAMDVVPALFASGTLLVPSVRSATPSPQVTLEIFNGRQSYDTLNRDCVHGEWTLEREWQCIVNRKKNLRSIDLQIFHHRSNGGRLSTDTGPWYIARAGYGVGRHAIAVGRLEIA